MISFLTQSDVAVALPLFMAATAAVLWVGPRLTTAVDALADRTAFGRSLAGSVLLGASTSLPGIVVTVVAAVRGDVALAAANAVGGVAAQTTFLGIADLAQRRSPLFRKAVTRKALTQLGVLFVLLAVPLFAISRWPQGHVFRLHPASLVLLFVYAGGLVAARREAGVDNEVAAIDRGSAHMSMPHLWGIYVAYVCAVAIAGFVIGTTISPLAEALGFTSIAAGALITAGVTSSPELVTSVAAARRGRLHLAVGDVVGGNSFDMLFLAFADLALTGSLYSKVGPNIVLLLAAAILLNAILLLGFVRDRGTYPFSPESILMIGVYIALAVALVTT